VQQPHLNVRRVVATTLSIYGRNLSIVLPVALVLVFIPLGIDLLIEHELPDVWASLLTAVIDSFATVIFSGAAEELVHRWEGGQRRIRLAGVLAKVPRVILPLFAVALVQAFALLVGLVLLVVPGLVAYTYFAVVGPVVVAERPGFRATFGRSARLVRGNAWRVFAIVLGLEVAAAVVGLVIGLILGLFGERPDEPVGLAIGETITLPLEALMIPVTYWRLRELRDA
jgi:hypothetical protein